MGSGAQQAASSRPGEQRDEADVHVAPKAGYASPYTHPSSTLPPGQELRMGLEENHPRSGFTLRSETQFNGDNSRTTTVWGSWT